MSRPLFLIGFEIAKRRIVIKNELNFRCQVVPFIGMSCDHAYLGLVNTGDRSDGSGVVSRFGIGRKF